MSYSCRIASLFITTLLLCGCGGKSAQVSGVVTLDGESLNRGTVGFTPVGGGLRSAGVIQPDGSYVLSTNRDVGLETGEYAVTVVSREPGRASAGGPPMPGPYITPQRYAVDSTSGLKYSVERGDNTINIELSRGADGSASSSASR